jgi:hypothetical protein
MNDRIKTDIRFYLPSDPYYFEVDNLPIKELTNNDQILQFQIDQLKAKFEGLTGRDTFNDLKPYIDETSPGKVYVKPGSFIGRTNIPSDRYTGLEGRLDDGENTVRTIVAQPTSATHDSQNAIKGVARTSFIRVLKTDGEDISVAIPSFTEADYPAGNLTNNQAPAYRLDLVFVEAYPAEDNDNGKPKLGIITGGYLLDYPDTVSTDRKEGDRFTDSLDLNGRTIQMQSQDIEIGEIIEEKKNSTERVKYTTVPSPDDLKNFIFRPQTLVNVASGTEIDSDIPTDEQLVAEWASKQFENRGTFCLPICYVLVPFGYLAGGFITTDNLIDIRPFFRTAELTFDERQAVAASFQPSLKNRFLTRKDPDYTDLRNTWVRGNGQAEPGNHEGRIKTLKDRVDNLAFDGAYYYETPGQCILLNDDYGGTHEDYLFSGTEDIELTIEIPLEDMPAVFKPDFARGVMVRFDIFCENDIRMKGWGKPATSSSGYGVNNRLFHVGNFADVYSKSWDTIVGFVPVDITVSNIRFKIKLQVINFGGFVNASYVEAVIIGHSN